MSEAQQSFRAWNAVGVELMKAMVIAGATYWGIRLVSQPVSSALPEALLARVVRVESRADLSEAQINSVATDMRDIKSELRELNVYLRNRGR